MTATIALVVSYNGRGFHGYQYQNDSLPTVQLALESALSNVADHRVRLTCAGRTDAGVHATHQVVSFDTTAQRPLKAWVMGANRHLPDGIAVVWSGVVPDGFSARFSATARRYFYLIENTPIRSPLTIGLLTHEKRPLDANRMEEAGAGLIGEHDFTSFRASSCSARTPFREVRSLAVRRSNTVVTIDIVANAFLHHMVRNIAAVLMDIGAGRRSVDWAGELLDLRDRASGGVTGRPDGLYLVDVSYPLAFGIPAGPTIPNLYSGLAS